MVYVKLVNMEDKPCGISHEFVNKQGALIMAMLKW